MLPSDLKPEHFSAYPPEARRLALAHLDALRQLPFSFLPSLLRELIDYDYRFPAERAAIDKELDHLSSLTPAQMPEWFADFSRVSISAKLESYDWVNRPGQFTEQLSAYLWSTHQLDDFRKAATSYGNRVEALAPPQPPPVRRLGIAVIGKGVDSYNAPLFRGLRSHGTFFTQVKPEDGLNILLAGVAARAKAHPAPYGHWYVDGGELNAFDPSLTIISYQNLAPARTALLRNIQTETQRPGMGPEELRTHMARLLPADLGMASGDDVLNRFQVRLLTEGSGTQIFSTTFAQWTAREVLRRAQALTLLVRFSPRQQQRPMNELLSDHSETAGLDPIGSLVDADMGAYYNWINQQRLPGADQSAFIAWFEGHNQAVVIAPTMPRGVESSSSASLKDLLTWAEN